MTTRERHLRRRLLRHLEDPRLSRDELARELEAVPGLAEVLREDARRAGVEATDAGAVLARLGTGLARRAVKRFFLRPDAHLPENQAA
jgi:hypothetical protein